MIAQAVNKADLDGWVVKVPVNKLAHMLGLTLGLANDVASSGARCGGSVVVALMAGGSGMDLSNTRLAALDVSDLLCELPSVRP